MAEFSNLLDSIDLDRIRDGDSLALADALKKIYNGINRTITRVDQLALNSAATPLYCRLYKRPGQTIVSGVDTFLKWSTPPVPGDTISGVNIGGMFDPDDTSGSYGANADEYVFLREPGLYLIEANIWWAESNAVGDRRASLELLGSLDLADDTRDSASNTTTIGLRQTLQALVPWRGLQGDTGLTWNGHIAITVFQNSGGDRIVGSPNPPGGNLYYHWLGVTRVAAVR